MRQCLVAETIVTPSQAHPSQSGGMMTNREIGFIKLLWRWTLRKKRLLLARLRLEIELFSNKGDLRIIVGSSATKLDGWISTEYPCVDISDSRTLKRFFRPASVSNFLAEHVLEHLTPEKASLASANLYSLLKSGGRWRIAVPDGFHPDGNYIEQVRPGGTGEGSDDHKILYNIESLSDLLSKAGFMVESIEWFDRSGRFNSVEWNPEGGQISRSLKNDPRNQIKRYGYTSLIVDAVKS